MVEVVAEELRCRRSDGKAWRCKKPKLHGSSVCEHHQKYGRRRWNKKNARRQREIRNEENRNTKRKKKRDEDWLPSQSDEAEEVDDLSPVAESVRLTRLRDIDGPHKRVGTCRSTKINEEVAECHQNIAPMTAPEKLVGAKARNYSEEGVSEVLGGIKFLRTPVEFKDVTSLENFTVAVNGMILDSELSEQARRKYYEICCSEKCFLHQNLRKAVNFKLAAGIISQTINIADEIRHSKLTTSLDEFAEWDSMLVALEQLGMNVGFLRIRIKKLLGLVCESEEGVGSQKYWDATVEMEKAKEEIEMMEEQLIELEEAYKRLDYEMETLEDEALHYKLKFQEEVDAPWEEYSAV